MNRSTWPTWTGCCRSCRRSVTSCCSTRWRRPRAGRRAASFSIAWRARRSTSARRSRRGSTIPAGTFSGTCWCCSRDRAACPTASPRSGGPLTKMPASGSRPCGSSSCCPTSTIWRSTQRSTTAIPASCGWGSRPSSTPVRRNWWPASPGSPSLQTPTTNCVGWPSARCRSSVSRRCSRRSCSWWTAARRCSAAPGWRRRRRPCWPPFARWRTSGPPSSAPGRCWPSALESSDSEMRHAARPVRA